MRSGVSAYGMGGYNGVPLWKCRPGDHAGVFSSERRYCYMRLFCYCQFGNAAARKRPSGAPTPPVLPGGPGFQKTANLTSNHPINTNSARSRSAPRNFPTLPGWFNDPHFVPLLVCCGMVGRCDYPKAVVVYIGNILRV
jgi:hypothetical protein